MSSYFKAKWCCRTKTPSYCRVWFNSLSSSFITFKILGQCFCDHGVSYLPTEVLWGVSSMEKLLHCKSDYSFLKVFSCLCFPYLRPYNSHKCNFGPFRARFLANSTRHKGYKCLAPNGQLYISSHVTFDETSFPFASKTSATYSTLTSPSSFSSPCQIQRENTNSVPLTIHHNVAASDVPNCSGFT